MSPITATTSENSNAILSIPIFMSFNEFVVLIYVSLFQCLEADGIRIQVVVNKTTLRSVFDTIISIKYIRS